MKKNHILILLLAVSVGLLFSCKSTPQAEEPAPEPAPVETPEPAPEPPPLSLDALNEASARAEAARKRAADFDSQSYFPSDWQVAESNFAAAKQLPATNADEVQKAAAACNDAATGYDTLFDKTIPLYAQAREDEVIAARDELIATGLTYDYPEPLEDADQTALQALDQYEAKDYYGAKDTAATALVKYTGLTTAANAYLAREELIATGLTGDYPGPLEDADQTALQAVDQYEAKDYYGAKDTAETALVKYTGLTTAANAYLAREEILDNSFYSYDAENFDKADEVGLAAIDAYEAGDLAAASNHADDALLRYNLVLNTGWASHVAGRANTAGAERQKAVALKANVAVRDQFNQADAVYNQAAASLRAENFREAANQYADSQNLFIAAGRAAEEKRRLAEDAIKEAEAKMEASDEAARQAEIIIGGDSL